MAYLQAHDHNPGPIFQRHDGSPLSQFFKFIGLDASRYAACVSRLHPMRLIRECLTLKFEPWVSNAFFASKQCPISCSNRQGMMPWHFHDETDYTSSKGSSPFIWFYIFNVISFPRTIMAPYNLYFSCPLLIV